VFDIGTGQEKDIEVNMEEKLVKIKRLIGRLPVS